MRTARFRWWTAVPAFGDKNHVSADHGFGLMRKWTATDAAAHDGARLEEILGCTNTASDMWADTAYRSAKNEAGRGELPRLPRPMVLALGFATATRSLGRLVCGRRGGVRS